MPRRKEQLFLPIPLEVAFNPNISSSAKLLYGELKCLCASKGYCWATNQYLANVFQVKTNSITRWLDELEENKCIYREFQFITDTIKKERKIYTLK